MRIGKTLFTVVLIFLTLAQGFSISYPGCPQSIIEESRTCEGHSCCKAKSQGTVQHQKRRMPSWKNSIFCVEVVSNVDINFPPLMEENNPCCGTETKESDNQALTNRTIPSQRDVQILFVEDFNPIVQLVHFDNIINEEQSPHPIEIIEITRLLC